MVVGISTTLDVMGRSSGVMAGCISSNLLCSKGEFMIFVSVDTLLTQVAEDAKYWVDCNLATDNLGIRSCTKRVLTHLGLDIESVEDDDFALIYGMLEGEFRWHEKLKEALGKELM
jgi:hypothetical protein